MVRDNVFELHRLRKSFRFHPPRKPVDHHEELRQLREDVWNDENILCEDFQCAIDNQGETSEWFDIKTGVKQGCNMSGFVFLIVMDWVMG